MLSVAGIREALQERAREYEGSEELVDLVLIQSAEDEDDAGDAGDVGEFGNSASGENQ